MSEDPRQYLNDNEEGSRLMLDGRQSGIWSAMPGIVQSVNLAQMTCVVQLAIQGRFEDQNGNISYVNISPLHDVPIVFPGAGQFILTFPIAAGDEVLVVFASRCIDSWWQSGGYNNKPLEIRMHDLSDGFAIPGPKSVPNAVPAISATTCQLRNKTGTIYLEITNSGVNIVAPVHITGAVSVTGAVSMTGDLTVTGNILASNEITAKTSGTAIPLSTHVHTGVTAGTAHTGAPIP